MEHLAENGDRAVRPDSASYSTVMTALANSGKSLGGGDPAGAARKADALLRKVEEGYALAAAGYGSVVDGGAPAVEPDTILFNTAMSCWSRSYVSGSYRRARSILDRQIALHEKHGCAACKPDVYGYTTVISACAAECGDKRERSRAFSVALQTFRQLQQLPDNGGDDSSLPNHVTYGAMLKACAKCLPASSPLRQKWSKRVFQDCCEAGMVGDMVVSKLREAVPPDVYRELMQGHSKRSLPSEWTRNVIETNEFRKKRANNNNNNSKNKRRRRAEV
jgi:hypothetical protein